MMNIGFGFSVDGFSLVNITRRDIPTFAAHVDANVYQDGVLIGTVHRSFERDDARLVNGHPESKTVEADCFGQNRAIYTGPVQEAMDNHPATGNVDINNLTQAMIDALRDFADAKLIAHIGA